MATAKICFFKQNRNSKVFRMCACLIFYLCHKACDLHGGSKATVTGYLTLPISLTCYCNTVGYVCDIMSGWVCWELSETWICDNVYFSNLDCDTGYSDQIFVWTSQLLKTKELHCMETLGNGDPVVQCRIHEDLNPPPSSSLLFCHFTLHSPSLWQWCEIKELAWGNTVRGRTGVNIPTGLKWLKMRSVSTV